MLFMLLVAVNVVFLLINMVIVMLLFLFVVY